MRLKGMFILILLSTGMIFGQQTRTLTGKVLNAETRETLPGATIQIEGTSLGTATDLQGNFSLGNISGESIRIRVSFLGHESIVVPWLQNFPVGQKQIKFQGRGQM
jgi:hypothetical protein